MKRAQILFPVLLAVVLLTGCSLVPPLPKDQSGTDHSAPAVRAVDMKTPSAESSQKAASVTADSSPSEETAPPKEQRVTLMAVGDIMVHQEQLEAAWDPESESYQFDPFFSEVKPVLKEADLVIGNLETTLAGGDLRFTGYPQFNSPQSLAESLKKAGFTAVTTANNHALDRREIGVLRTLEHLRQAGLAHTGTFRSQEERDQPLLLEHNGIQVALLAYTYGTNGIPLPKDKPYLVNLIQPELIAQDIAKARQQGADLITVSLHFGNEYQRLPNEEQRKLVDQCFEYGADLIIGHHPHVLQPYEWRTLTDESGRTRRGLVVYSLGNFISAQRGDYKDVGAIFAVTLLKRGEGDAVLEEAELIPTYVHYYRSNGKRHYVIYPLAKTLAIPEEERSPLINPALYRKMERLYNEITTHTSRYVTKQPAVRQ